MGVFSKGRKGMKVCEARVSQCPIFLWMRLGCMLFRDRAWVDAYLGIHPDGQVLMGIGTSFT